MSPPDDPWPPKAGTFEASLLASANVDTAPTTLEERILRAMAEDGDGDDQASAPTHRRPPEPTGPLSRGGNEATEAIAAPASPWGLRVYSIVATGCALAAAAVLVVGRFQDASHEAKPVAAAEEALVASSSAAPSRPPDAPAVGLPQDPCAHPVRAPGHHPRIDDFQDLNSRLLAFEGRSGNWNLITDVMKEGVGLEAAVRPSLLDGGDIGGPAALHVHGGRFDRWGAVLQGRFGPHCYDISAYQGVRFRAKGPAHITVRVEMTAEVARRYGGTCDVDSQCYNHHGKAVQVGSSWESYEVTWDDLAQQRAPKTPFDPRKTIALGFQLEPVDTPFDFWIDSVEFIPR